MCAVSYLNTVPLVWGMLHGPQRDAFDLSFSVPSECADRVSSGAADIGIIPCVELLRQDLKMVPGLGIVSRGPVRSILLISKKPLSEVRTLAGDVSSRTSVALTRIVLARRYGALPEVVSRPPDLARMLEAADAALIIGDPALRLDPAGLPWAVHDMGAEWTGLTGLPMVFAVWAGRSDAVTEDAARVFHESYSYGRSHLEEIIRQESESRGLPPELAREYLTRRIVFEVGDAERKGLERFLEYARELA